MKRFPFMKFTAAIRIACVAGVTGFFGTALLPAESPTNTPDAPTKTVKKCENGNLVDKTVPEPECIEYILPIGGSSVYPGLSGNRVKFIKMAPAPDLFTSRTLFIQGAAMEAILSNRTESNGSRQFLFYDPNGELIVYRFASGATAGAPEGKHAKSKTRAYLLTAAGAEVPNAKDSGAVFLELRNEDASSVRYAIEDGGRAVYYKDAKGQGVDLLNLPEAVRPEVVKDGDLIRQIKSASGLIDIVNLPENAHGLPTGFEMRLYVPGQVAGKTDGLYNLEGAPYRTVRVTRTNAESKDEKRVTIADRWGTREDIFLFEYLPVLDDWQMRRGDRAYREEKRVERDDANGRTFAKTLYDKNDAPVSKKRFTEKEMPWGAIQTMSETIDPDGLNYTTTYAYHMTKGAPGYGLLASETRADGSWARYVYDAKDRLVKTITPWQDSPLTAGENDARVVEYGYAPNMSGDVLTPEDTRPRLEIEKICGIEVGRTYYAYGKNASGETEEITERAAAQGAAFGGAGNLRTTRTYYEINAGNASAGRLKTVKYPDGRFTSYTYSSNPSAPDAFLITTETEGTASSPGGVSGKTLRKITTENARGKTVREETLAFIAGGYVTTEILEHVYSEQGFLTETKKNGAVVYEASYDANLRVSETGADGIRRDFVYDSLDRILSETQKAVGTQPDKITTYNRTLGGLDCGCDAAAEIVVTAGGLSLNTFVKKDQAGRVTEQTDASGMTTTYAYTDGGKTTTIAQPNTAVEIRQTALDGQTKSVTGDGILPEYTTAGVNGDGTRWEKTTLGSPAGARWTKTTTDFLGRPIRVERPGFAGAMITETSTYDNATGRLASSKQTVTGGNAPSSSLSSVIHNLSYAYDAVGTLLKTTVTRGDVTNITETDTSYVTAAGGVWRESFQKQDGVTMSRSRKRLGVVGNITGESWTMSLPQSNMPNAAWDETTATHQIVTLERSTATTVATTKLPTSIQPSITTFVAGLTVSSVSPSHGGTAFYRHDALGRQTGQKEPRHTAYSKIEYNDKGQIVKTTDAAGNATTYLYYANGEIGAGQLRMTTDALGGTVFKQYDLAGREIYTWGSATYPIAQAYDIFGQRVLLRTFRDTTANFAGTAFPQAASGDTTTWTYDEAAGVLLQKTYADGKGPTYDYYADGQLKTRLWARLNPATGERLATNYAYNPQGQLAGIDYADDTPDVTYTYNARGQVAQITDGTGTRTYDYDSATFALTAENYISGIHTGGSLHRSYDQYNRPIGYALTGNASGSDATTETVATAVSYTYDANGRLNTVSGDTIPVGLPIADSQLPNASLFSYARLPDSDLIASVNGPVYNVLNVYEHNRDVLSVKENRLNSDTIVSRYAYTYDTLGRRTNREQSGTAFEQTSDDTFSYNPRSEVIGAVNSQNNALNRGYAYDPIGNRLSAIEGTAQSKSYISNNLNQYPSVSSVSSVVQPIYDVDGNMVSDGEGKTYAWDSENRLIAVTLPNGEIIRYAYDSRHRRIEREHHKGEGIETTHYTYDGWNVIAEGITWLSSDRRELNTYVWGLDLSNTLQGVGGIGGLLSCKTQSSSVNNPSSIIYCYSYDANGNVSEVIDFASTVAARYQYDPFGNITLSTGFFADKNTYRFSTKSWDESAELNYYSYRFYHSETSRWTNRDPIGENGGVNLYSFVKNDPVGKYDILGLACDVEICVRPLSALPDWLPWWASPVNHAYIQIGGWSAGFQSDGKVYSPEKDPHHSGKKCSPAVKKDKGQMPNGISCECASCDDIQTCIKKYAKKGYPDYSWCSNNCGHWVINALENCCLKGNIPWHYYGPNNPDWDSNNPTPSPPESLSPSSPPLGVSM